jgi:hypothetical protein
MKTIVKKILDFRAIQTKRKLVIIMSDDWGSLRIKSKEDQKILEQKGLKINNRFDRFDTLETNEDLELLFDVLTKHKDVNGNHPVITAVTNVGNPDFKRIREANFQNYYFESIDETYKRNLFSDRVLSLVQEGIQNKIYVPQSHGREHVQVNWSMEELHNETSFARKFFENEFFFLSAAYLTKPKRGRGIGASFDIWNEGDVEATKLIAQNSLALFNQLFGYSSKVFTPPAMFYNIALEPILKKSGVEWIDVGRHFKEPRLNGKQVLQWNYLGKEKKSGLKVLVRNCMFETNMSENDNGVHRCLFDIEQAFKCKQPAIISNHRASFVGGISEKNRDNGLQALDILLKSIKMKWPDAEFISASELEKLI